MWGLENGQRRQHIKSITALLKLPWYDGGNGCITLLLMKMQETFLWSIFSKNLFNVNDFLLKNLKQEKEEWVDGSMYKGNVQADLGYWVCHNDLGYWVCHNDLGYWACHNDLGHWVCRNDYIDQDQDIHPFGHIYCRHTRIITIVKMFTINAVHQHHHHGSIPKWFL